MIVIPGGRAPYPSPDGRWAALGFNRAWVQHMETGEVRHCPVQGEHNPCGWLFDNDVAISIWVSGTARQLVTWNIKTNAIIPTNIPPEQCPGYIGFVCPGVVMSEFGGVIYLNGAAIHSGFSGLVGDGIHWLSKRMAGDPWPTVVGRCSDGAIVREFVTGRLYEQVYTNPTGSPVVPIADIPLAPPEGHVGLSWHPETKEMVTWTHRFDGDGAIALGRPGIPDPAVPCHELREMWQSGFKVVPREFDYLVAGFREDTSETRIAFVPYDEPRTVYVPVVAPVEPPTVPVLTPANRKLWTGEWDASSEPWPHTDGCDGKVISPPGVADNCQCGALGKGATYGYHDWRGNLECCLRWCDLSKRKRPETEFLAGIEVAKAQLTERGRCRGVGVHFGSSEQNETKLAAAREQADRLGVPVWLYVDTGAVWEPWQVAMLRSHDVAWLNMYRAFDESRETARERFQRLTDAAVTWGRPLATCRRNFRGRAEMTLEQVMESHEDISAIVAATTQFVADTMFCRAPGARLGPQEPGPHAELDDMARQVFEGSTGVPDILPIPIDPPVDTEPLILFVVSASGRAPLTVHATVYPVQLTSFRWWIKREPFGKYKKATDDTALPATTFRLLLPGRYAFHAQRLSDEQNTDSVTLTVTAPAGTGGGFLAWLKRIFS